MQIIGRKQAFAFAVTVVLVFGLVRLNGTAQQVSAQSGLLAATPIVTVGTANRNVCPDTTKPIITPTATQSLATLSATLSASVVSSPRAIARSRLTRLTQPGEFDLVHIILDFEAGVTSAPYFYQGTVNLIVVQGTITYCSGSLQRVLTAGDSWTVPPQVRFILANTGSDMARLSVVDIEPHPTSTETATATQTPIATVSTPLPTSSPAPTQTGTATATAAANAVAYIGLRAVGVDNMGVRVTGFLPSSPSEAAQVHVGDVITAVDTRTLASLLAPSAVTPKPNESQPIVAAFFQLIESHRPGDTVQLTVQRDNQTITINVKLGGRPATS